MKLTNYFLPVMKDDPADAQIVSHRLMVRAGLVRQAVSGIYSWLPMGLKVLENIQRIVHCHEQEAGALNMLMPTIQPLNLWNESGRSEDYGQELLQFKDRHGRDMLYGPTNEDIFHQKFTTAHDAESWTNFISELPLYVIKIQRQFPI
jgi:prolyl-tRNA synthetase